MRRKRPFFRRVPPQGKDGRPLPHQRPPHPLFVKAQRLFDDGEFEEAAKIFEDIADRAVERDGPRAPLFYFRCGSAYYLGNLPQKGKAALDKAIDMLAARKQYRVLDQRRNRIVELLKEQGFNDDAEYFVIRIKGLMPEKIANVQTIKTDSRKKIPLNCTSCGASLHPDEIEWVDSDTVECSYCGSLNRTE